MTRKRNRTPSLKQIKALQLINQGYSKHRAMLEAGYSEGSSRHPKVNLMNSKAVASVLESMKSELVDSGLTGKYMAKKFQEWLEAKKIVTSPTEEDKVLPDYDVQIKAYDRWEKRMGEPSGGGNGLKRKVTFEEFVTGEEKEIDASP